MFLIITLRKTTPVSKVIKLLHILFGYMIVFRTIFEISIHISAIDRHNTGSIFCLFHSAFNFKRENTALCKLWDILDRAEIFRA